MLSSTEGVVRAPLWISIIAALLMLTTVLLGFGPMVVLAPRPNPVTAGPLPEVKLKDPLVNLVPLSAMAAILISAVVLAVAVRRPRTPLALALVPFTLPFVVAFTRNLANPPLVLEATKQALRDDGRIEFYLRQVAWLFEGNVFALSFAATACFLVALASLVALAGPVRAGRGVTAAGVGLLGVSLALTLQQTLALQSTFVLLGRAQSPDSEKALLAFVDGQSGAPLLALAASLSVTVIGGVILSRRGDPKSGVSVIVAGVGLALSMQLLVVLADRSLLADPGFAEADASISRFDGHIPQGLIPFEALPEEDALDAQVHDRTLSALAQGWTGLELREGLPRDRVLRMIQITHASATNFELTGILKKPRFEVPSRFGALAKLSAQLPTSAPMRILFTEEPCSGCAGIATLRSEGLEVMVGGAPMLWSPDAVSYGDELEAFPGVDFTWNGEVSELARASLIALAHRHMLVVRVPPPDPPPAFLEPEDAVEDEGWRPPYETEELLQEEPAEE